MGRRTSLLLENKKDRLQGSSRTNQHESQRGKPRTAPDWLRSKIVAKPKEKREVSPVMHIEIKKVMVNAWSSGNVWPGTDMSGKETPSPRKKAGILSMVLRINRDVVRRKVSADNEVV